MGDGLRFADLNEQNVARAKRWHPGFPADDDWNGADWSNAMCGEAGEAANVVKKLRRSETGKSGVLDKPPDEMLTALADELADVVTYADLLATKYGIDLGAAVAAKFNRVSERQGFAERLPESVPDSIQPKRCPTCGSDDPTEDVVPADGSDDWAEQMPRRFVSNVADLCPDTFHSQSLQPE